MSVDSVLDQALTTLLEKARQRAADVAAPAVRPASMKFGWVGGGLPIAVAIDPITLVSAPTSCDPYELDVPFPSVIVWARLKAGDAHGMPVAVSATVDIQLSAFETFGAQTPLYGTGAIPALSSAYKVDLDLLGWHTNLITGDTLTARLVSFTGLATWVSLSIQLRPSDVPIGVSAITDASGAGYTDASGTPYVIRS